LAFKSEGLTQSIQKLQVAQFYTANIAQAAAGVGEATAGVIAEPFTFGVSTVAVVHGADVTGTAVLRSLHGPEIDVQSSTSLAFQFVGFNRKTAEFGDASLSFVVPAAQLTQGATSLLKRTAVPVGAANTAVPQVLRNQTQGALGEAAVRARLLNSNRLELVGEQMRVTTPGVDSYRITDFMVQSRQTGRLSIIEVKTGGATRDVTQLAKDALIGDPLVPTTFTGSRSAAAGYPSSTPTGPIRTFEVNASNLRR
jgi:hypothetical protein